MCVCANTFFNILNFEPPNYRKFIKNLLGVGRIRQLGCQVLSGPMLIMLAVSPQSRSANVVYQMFVSHPNFRLVLPVTQGQLWKSDDRKLFLFQGLKFCLWKENTMLMQKKAVSNLFTRHESINHPNQNFLTSLSLTRSIIMNLSKFNTCVSGPIL